MVIAGVGSSAALAGSIVVSPPELVSRSYLGGAAAGTCATPLFALGQTRWLTFACLSGDLVPGDNNGRSDVFLLDRDSGALERISLTSAGTEVGFAGSLSGYPSDDGRFVVFQSGAYLHPDVIPPPPEHQPQVFLRDRLLGTTELVSRDFLGSPRTRGFQLRSAAPGLSIATVQTGNHLLEPVIFPISGPENVYVLDWSASLVELISISTTGGRANDNATLAAVSGNGRFVIFGSSATNLVPAPPPNGFNLYLRDRLLQSTEVLTRPFAGGQFGVPMELDFWSPKISADGRFVAFASSSRELLPVDPAVQPLTQQVYLLDRQVGQLERISVTAAGVPGNHYNGAPDVSDDGRFVAFYSQSTNLPAGQRAIYVIDRSSGDWYTVTQPLGTHLFGNEYLDLAGDGSSIAFAWAASVPSLPGFGRLNIYTVELQGQPPAREVGSVGSAAIVLLLALLAITASRRLAGRVRKTVSF
jgi:hypothetical protein